MDGEAKCNCQRCGQPIAFPLDLHNTEAACPHCGKTTTLIVPRVRAAAPDSAPVVIAAPASAKNSPYGDLGGLVLVGYLTAIFMPLIGFIIGIILLTKNRPGSGIGCIIVSVICGFIALAIFSSM
jgi:DNA-directed RNA polymerase subunit RPC12/RpoP